MNRITQWVKTVSQYPSAIFIVLIVAAILHIGSTVTGRLYADDYIQSALFTGSQVLVNKQLTLSAKPAEFLDIADQQFNFYDTSAASFKAYKDFGVLPWWTSNDAMLHFFRPLATLTHYLDYQLWPDNAHIMQGVSLLWYLLALGAIYACYRSFSLPKTIALFALVLVILDHSVFQVVSWLAARNMLMAIAFSFVAILAYHKSMHSVAWYGVALLALLCSLLSAEGGVVACCYLGAYIFTLDARPWFKRIAHILPFVCLVVAWRVYYQVQGYGASGVDFYLDPGRNPIEFLQLALIKIGSSFFELWSGLDVMSGQIRPDIRQLLGLVGIIVLVFMAVLIKGVNRTSPLLSKAATFFLLGSLFSLLPGLAVALSPRVMIFPFIGLSVVLAELCLMPANKIMALTPIQQKLRVFFNAYTWIVHVVLSLLAALLVLISSVFLSETKINANPALANIEDKHLVIISTKQPFASLFLAHELAFNQQALPKHSRVLTTNWYAIKIERLSELELRLSTAPAFQFDAGLSGGEQYDIHYAYLMQQLLGLVRKKEDAWLLGEIITLPEMSIRIDSVLAIGGVNKPSVLSVTLTDALPSYHFVIWDVAEEAYTSFQLPPIGESVIVEGLFNSPQ